MENYKKEFIEFMVRAQALKFGSFTLKSGRQAPFFLNAGAFYTGEHLYTLGKAYAEAYRNSGTEADIIFGPAYKGIPLAVVTTGVLYKEYGKDLAYSFNRKEAKTYGMNDTIVGAPLEAKSRVLIIDDVITAGTAIRETVTLLKNHGDPKIAGILIAVDRQEKNNDGVHALVAIEQDVGVKVFAIVTLDEIIEHLSGRAIDGVVYIDDEKMEVIKKYRAEYGA